MSSSSSSALWHCSAPVKIVPSTNWGRFHTQFDALFTFLQDKDAVHVASPVTPRCAALSSPIPGDTGSTKKARSESISSSTADAATDNDSDVADKNRGGTQEKSQCPAADDGAGAASMMLLQQLHQTASQSALLSQLLLPPTPLPAQHHQQQQDEHSSSSVLYTACTEFVAEQRRRARNEKSLVSIKLDEYRARAALERRCWQKLSAMASAAEGEQCASEVPPSSDSIDADNCTDATLQTLDAAEAQARGSIVQSWKKFVHWVCRSTPDWLHAVTVQQQQQTRDAATRQATLAAAKAALTQELMQGMQLGVSGNRHAGLAEPLPVREGVCVSETSYSSPESVSVTVAPRDLGDPVRSDDGATYTRHAHEDPNARNRGVEETHALPAKRSANNVTDVQHLLRRQAIAMLTGEDADCGRDLLPPPLHTTLMNTTLHTYRQAPNPQPSASDDNQSLQSSSSLAARAAALAAQEHMLEQRVAERAAAQSHAREAQCRATLEQLAAEEALLTQRLQQEEERRKAAAAELERQQRQHKAILYEQIRAEEKVLQQRIQSQEEAAAAQAESARRVREQEEAMRRAKEEQHRIEQQRQLAYLREQEADYLARMRKKEVAEIEARAQETQQQQKLLLQIQQQLEQQHEMRQQVQLQEQRQHLLQQQQQQQQLQIQQQSAIMPSQPMLYMSSPPSIAGGYPAMTPYAMPYTAPTAWMGADAGMARVSSSSTVVAVPVPYMQQTLMPMKASMVAAPSAMPTNDAARAAVSWVPPASASMLPQVPMTAQQQQQQQGTPQPMGYPAATYTYDPHAYATSALYR